MIFGRGLALLTVAFIAGAATAHADIVYNWIPETQVGYPGLNQSSEIEVTDAAVESGSVSVSVSCGALGGVDGGIFCKSAGNFAKLVLITGSVPGGTLHFPTIQNDLTSLLIDLTFNPDGTLSGDVAEVTQEMDLEISGASRDWTGEMNSDLMNCSYVGAPSGPCKVTGYWATTDTLPSIPEPSSLPIAISGLGAFFVLRRRVSIRCYLS